MKNKKKSVNTIHHNVSQNFDLHKLGMALKQPYFLN